MVLISAYIYREIKRIWLDKCMYLNNEMHMLNIEIYIETNNEVHLRSQ